MAQIKGTFSIKSIPQPSLGEASISHTTFRKEFSGDLAATSVVEMLAVHGSVKGSAAYVAMEKVTGTLIGRKGSFFLHHTGIMERGAPSLEVRVVPDSATDELVGLAGSLKIDIEQGQHFYTFDFTFADA